MHSTDSSTDPGHPTRSDSAMPPTTVFNLEHLMTPSRLRTVSLLALTVLISVGWSVHQARQDDEAGVRAALEHYLQGHATGQGDHFRQAFHPEAKLFWVQDGQLAQRTSEEYIAGARGEPAPDEVDRVRRIEHIDITGNAASAKIVLDYPRVVFTDYMSLLKINGEWKIVNKIFTREPK